MDDEIGNHTEFLNGRRHVHVHVKGFYSLIQDLVSMTNTQESYDSTWMQTLSHIGTIWWIQKSSWILGNHIMLASGKWDELMHIFLPLPYFQI